MAAAKLTEAEWSVMDALWERGELTGREAAELLRGHEAKLHELAKFLCEKETITGDEFMAILERTGS